MSEALCQCGHGEDCPKHREGERWSRPNDCTCPTPPPTREPINDEAEAEMAWLGWEEGEKGPTTWARLHAAFLAGFRAARQEDA